MKILVKLYLDFKKYAPDNSGSQHLDVPEGADIRWLLDHLAIPPELKKVILVEGRYSEVTSVLHEGETVTIFPPLEGG